MYAIKLCIHQEILAENAIKNFYSTISHLVVRSDPVEICLHEKEENYNVMFQNENKTT